MGFTITTREENQSRGMTSWQCTVCKYSLKVGLAPSKRPPVRPSGQYGLALPPVPIRTACCIGCLLRTERLRPDYSLREQ